MRIAILAALAAFPTLAQAQAPFTPGSLYTPTGRLGDLGRDFRASQLDDVVTVVVSDRASALARGTTNSARKSAASASIGTLLGPVRAAGPLANLAGADSAVSLDGQGQTSRETVLTTTLSARVIHVYANGNLLVEGVKQIRVNSEMQTILVRGIARWNDIGPANRIGSDRLADLTVEVQGKGVVGDALRRPNFLYRILLGLLPF
ncbi:MAG: flagellar basal body L-ring protein FlgH [Bryobacteraceae bacterium]